MEDLTPKFSILSAEEEIIIPSSFQDTPSQTVSGWRADSSQLTSGKVSIQANAERILIGDATAPMTGKGIFLGKDGSDYEMRVGDPANYYLHFDGADLNYVGKVSGRLTSVLASAINSAGAFINANLDTSAKTILSDFTFGASGAIKMITDADNGLWLSPTGILGKKAGATTFAIDIGGNATFAGTLSAVTGTFTSIYTNSVDAITLDYGGNILLKEGGSIKFTSVTAPTACTATLVTVAGNVDVGTHSYKVTFVNSTGETELGAISNVVTTDVNNKQVALSAIPVSSSGGVTARKIYRTKAGGSYYYLLTTINDNTTTTYTDNVADVNLTGDIANSRENDSFGKILVSGIESLSLGINTFVGQYCGSSNISGYRNSAIGYQTFFSNTTGYDNSAIGIYALFSNTTGYSNSAIGYAALNKNTSGHNNSAVGLYSLYSNTEGYYNTAIGTEALWSNITGLRNVAFGWRAGYYETGSDKLFIDNAARANEADGRVKSLIYGVFAAATANQKLTINGLLNQSVSKTPASAIAAGTAGDICWDASYIYVCVATDTWKRVGIATW